MREPIATAAESKAMSMPNMKRSTPTTISPMMLTAMQPMSSTEWMMPLAVMEAMSHKIRPIGIVAVISILSFLFWCGFGSWEREVFSFFAAPSSDVRVSVLPHRSFSFQVR